MLRKLALSLAVSAALGVPQAHALGLGEIQVHSALNEPLDAEIKLTQVRDLSPLQIQPRLAALDDYSRSGNVSQTRYLRDIQFQVLLTPDGDGRIRLRSSEPIQEPFLNFMVEVNWPSGRLVREYTLLLDPPVFDPTPVRRTLQPARVEAASESQAESRQAAAREPAPVVTPPATAASNIRTRMNSETQVYVGNHDTLWEIVSRHKLAGVSEHQMMLALLKKNPSAFPTGNINAMRAGVVMDLPSMEEATQVSHREAVAEVARQMQMWREGRVNQRLADSKAPVDVSRQQEEAPAGAEEKPTEERTSGDEAPEEGQLKIVAPQEEEPSAEQDESRAKEASETVTSEEAVTPPSEEDSISGVQNSLEDDVLIAQERIDRLERENADLNEKLSSVLEQLEAQSRLLELQSQQMATLQAELAENATRSADQDRDDGGLLQNPTLLGGIGAGILAILGGLWLMARRRGGNEPDKKRELVSVPEDLRETENKPVADASGSGAAPAAAAASGATVAAATSETRPAEPQQPPLSGDTETVRPEAAEPAADKSADSLDEDLQSLDMDLDLSELDPEETPDTAGQMDMAEFDLSTEEKPVLKPLSGEKLPTEEEGLEFKVDPVPAAEAAEQAAADESDGLDFLLAEEKSSGEDEEKLLEEALKEDPGFSLSDDAVELDDDSQTDEPAGDLDLEADEPVSDNGLHETVEPIDNDEFEIDEALEAMLQSVADEEPRSEPAAEGSEDDLESLLASLDADAAQTEEKTAAPAGEQVKEELTANISHDLETSVDSEVDELLSSTDDEIALEEQRNDEAVEVLDKMNLLSGTDETETKLDLARAYMEMDDKDGARDILNEITSEGTEEQRREAQKLLDSLG